MRSKRHIHAKRGTFVRTLRVQVGRGVPTPREMPQTVEKHAQRAAPTGTCFPCNGKLPKGNGFTFFSLLRKEPKVAEGPRPSRLPGTVQNSIDYVFSCCFRLSSLNWYVVRPTFSDVLNRYERVTVHQTQDRYFSKMGYCTTSSQGQAAFEKVGCTLSLLRWSFVFEVC